MAFPPDAAPALAPAESAPMSPMERLGVEVPREGLSLAALRAFVAAHAGAEFGLAFDDAAVIRQGLLWREPI